MSYYDGGSFSGESYDRHIFEANLSAVNKMQKEYWTAKQVLKKKFGKGEDQHVVASDIEIDSKLGLFESIQRTCVHLLKELEKYQQCICALARDENQLGRFLKDQGSQDKTQAGKMMAAVGKALCYSAQQRLLLRHPLGRLHQDVETFRYRAIADTMMSVDKMEEERTRYRASLLWMQDISANLDPEQYKKLEKFRKVQNEVRLNKEKFDRLKWAVCQKIDLLTASRSNLFSNTLVPYQDELLKFWEKTARTMSAVLESFNGYQHFEFKLLKGLNPIQESELAEARKNDKQKEGQKETDNQNDDALIDLDQAMGYGQEGGDNVADNLFQDALETLNLESSEEKKAAEDSLINFFSVDKENKDNANGGDIYDALRNPGPMADKGKTGDQDLFGDFTGPQETSVGDTELNDILGSNDQEEGGGDFERQWKSVFGEFESAQSTPPPQQGLAGPGPNTFPGPGQPAMGMQMSSQPVNYQGYLPSQLMDMNFGYHGFQRTPGFQPLMGAPQGMQQQMMANQARAVPNPPAYSALFSGGQGARPASGPAPHQPQKAKGSMADWYNLFAELDPLQNPDALGKKDNSTKKQEGGAC